MGFRSMLQTKGMHDMKSSIQVLVPSVFITFISICANAEKAKLTEQSAQLKSALSRIDSGGAADFAKWFPKNRKEFDETCNSPKFDQLYDCHEVFSIGVARALPVTPGELGPKLAKLASEVSYSADAPNYLQRAWNKFCLDNPKAFHESARKLGVAAQNRAFRYMTDGIEADDNADLEACAESLKKAGFGKMADQVRKNRVKEGGSHH
jgi:hypothetical protein